MLKIVQAYIIGENGVEVVVNTTDTVKGYTAKLNKQYSKKNVLRVEDITEKVIPDYKVFCENVEKALTAAQLDEKQVNYILAILAENSK